MSFDAGSRSALLEPACSPGYIARMSTYKNPRLVATATAALLFVAGCAHQAQFQDGLAPFSDTRSQTVGLVAHAKRSLDAADINTLAVAYTALEEKANAYASFMVEAVTATSFDSSRNDKYAGDLATAIAGFDRSYATLVATKRATIADAWVQSFAQSLQTRWNQYSGTIAKMSPQQKADLIAKLKRQTVWPNYEDIATEPLVSSRP